MNKIKPTSKNLIVSLFILIIINSCKKCDDPTIFNCGINEDIFTLVEQMPTFQAGSDSLNAFITNNLVYPTQSKIDKIEGIVTVQFIVNTFGHIDCIKIVKSLNSECDSEALRLINIMPIWIPGRHNNKPVPVSLALNISFKL